MVGCTAGSGVILLSGAASSVRWNGIFMVYAVAFPIFIAMLLWLFEPRRADGATFFQFSLAWYSGQRNRERAAPGTVNMWEEYTKWKKENPEAQARALSGGLIGSPETIRRKLRRFEASHVDQIILLNQAGKTSHKDICDSLELFAREVMPEFHAAEGEHAEWKRKVLAREIVLDDLDTRPYDIFSHQNEHIVRLSPEQLKAKMAEKEAAAKRA